MRFAGEVAILPLPTSPTFVRTRVPTSFPPNSPVPCAGWPRLVRRHEERHPPLDGRARARRGACTVAGDLEAACCAARPCSKPPAAGANDPALAGRGAACWCSPSRSPSCSASVPPELPLGDGTRPVNGVDPGRPARRASAEPAAVARQPGAARGAQVVRLQPGRPARSRCLALTGWLDRNREAADLPLALGGLLGRGRSAAWGVGAANHAVVRRAGGRPLGVLALLATRRYGFVWETTILPADTFVALSAARRAARHARLSGARRRHGTGERRRPDAGRRPAGGAPGTRLAGGGDDDLRRAAAAGARAALLRAVAARDACACARPQPPQATPACARC